MSFVEDSIFIGCLSMVTETIPLNKMFSDFQIDDPMIEEVLRSVYQGYYLVPVVHGFDLLAFLVICSKNPGEPLELADKDLDFLLKLSQRLQINLFAASISSKRQRELIKMSHYPFVLQRHESLQKLYANLLEDLVDQISFDCGVAYAYDEDSVMLFPVATYNVNASVTTLRPGAGISGQAMASGKSVFVPNRSDHPTYAVMQDEKFLDGSFISVPFGNEKKGMGVISLCRKPDSKESFSIEHQYMLEIAAAFIASEITNRQLFAKLDESNYNVVTSLTRALEAKDSYTEGHSERVTTYSVGIAKRLGYSDDRLHSLRYGAMLHDIGKIGIADTIINKPAKLTNEEYATIKNHTEIGYKILSVNPFFHDVKEFVRYHHESMDGSGYYGKKEGEYPEEAMVISCADIYDALTSDRPYRKALEREVAFQEMEKNVGIHFRRDIFEALKNYLATQDGKDMD